MTGFYLHDTVRADAGTVSVPTGANAAPGANDPAAILRDEVSDAYTSANLGSSGNFSMTIAAGSLAADTLIIPGFSIAGSVVGVLDSHSYQASILTLPTANVAIRAGTSLLTPEDPASSRARWFAPIDAKGPGPVKDRDYPVRSWRGWFVITFPSTTASSWTITINTNVGQQHRLLIPRILLGTRFTPATDFAPQFSTIQDDPTPGANQQGTLPDTPRNPSQENPTVEYLNVSEDDRISLKRMQSQIGKSGTMGFVPEPAFIDKTIYCKIINFNEDRINYNGNITTRVRLTLEEVTF